MRSIPMTHTDIENRSILLGMIVGSLSLLAVLAAVYFGHFQNLKMSVITPVVSLGVASVVFLGFMLGYHHDKNTFHLRGRWGKLRRLIIAISLATVHAAIGLLAVSAVGSLLGQFTDDASITVAALSLACGVVAAVAMSVGYTSAATMTSSKLASSLTAFVSAGVLASVVTSPDDFWWQNHFSALGRNHDISSYAFNLTMIVGGIVVVCLADYIASDFRRLRQMSSTYRSVRTNSIRAMLLAVGILTIIVGAVPYNSILIVHDSAAKLTFGVFALLIILLPWIAPMFSRVFFFLSYLLVVISAATYRMFFTGTLSLTVVELVAMLMLFIWLILFMRQINTIYLDEKEHYHHKQKAKIKQMVHQTKEY